MGFTPGSDPNAGAGGATVITGTVSVSGTVLVTGTVSVSGAVLTTGTVSVSGTVTVGAHAVNQGVASAVAWPVFTSQAVSGVVSVSGAVAANQGAASAVAWPFFTSQVVSSVITGFISVSNTVTVTGLVSVSNTVTVTGTVSTSGTVVVSGTANQGAASATAWPHASVASHTFAQAASVYDNNVISNVVSNVKASSGVVYGYTFYNPNQTIPAYIQFYKITAASVGLSTAVAPLFTVLMPSGSVVNSPPAGVPVGFATGIAIAATVSNSGSTANTLPIKGTIFYQ